MVTACCRMSRWSRFSQAEGFAATCHLLRWRRSYWFLNEDWEQSMAGEWRGGEVRSRSEEILYGPQNSCRP